MPHMVSKWDLDGKENKHFIFDTHALSDTSTHTPHPHPLLQLMTDLLATGLVDFRWP